MTKRGKQMQIISEAGDTQTTHSNMHKIYLKLGSS